MFAVVRERVPQSKDAFFATSAPLSDSVVDWPANVIDATAQDVRDAPFAVADARDDASSRRLAPIASLTVFSNTKNGVSVEELPNPRMVAVDADEDARQTAIAVMGTSDPVTTDESESAESV
jgi:hypothetical protein